MENKIVDFLMGANTPNGFYSMYSEFETPKKDYISYLIKGGAGTGKSSVMKNIGINTADKEGLTELIHCSSDPDSLDGIVLNDAKVSVIDATAPHIVEPSYPGGYERIINLIEYFDNKKINERLEKIVELQQANNNFHRICRTYLKSASLLLNLNRDIVENNTDYKKVDSLIKKLQNKYLKTKTDKKGNERIRLLSAVTNKGILVYENSITTLANTVVVLKDDYGVVSNYMLQQLKNTAVDNGYTVYSLMCPFSPDKRIEHLIIPELSLAFVTQNKFVELKTITPEKTILTSRFTNSDCLKSHKNLIAFNFKVANELIRSAILQLQLAKLNHNLLEEQFSGCVDFKRVNLKTKEIISDILKRY